MSLRAMHELLADHDVAWLLRELNGAVADVIDEKMGDVPPSLRVLETALRSILSDPKALKVLEKKESPLG